MLERTPMGVDLYLNSIWEPFIDSHQGELKRLSVGGIEAAAAWFDKCQSCGGYFRNAYNAYDFMWAIGLSWSDVEEMLDPEDSLPIDRARALLDLVEARPLMRERLSRHYKELNDGNRLHPVVKALGFTGAMPVPMPLDFESFCLLVGKRREQFLAILNKSLQLGEPLECSL